MEEPACVKQLWQPLGITTSGVLRLACHQLSAAQLEMLLTNEDLCGVLKVYFLPL